MFIHFAYKVVETVGTIGFFVNTRHTIKLHYMYGCILQINMIPPTHLVLETVPSPRIIKTHLEADWLPP